MFENKKTAAGIHYTRYIESWRNAGGNDFGEYFEEWLVSEGLTQDEIRDIKSMYGCGKLELEKSAGKYVAMQKKEIEEILKEED
jgi:hypothetical protein